MSTVLGILQWDSYLDALNLSESIYPVDIISHKLCPLSIIELAAPKPASALFEKRVCLEDLPVDAGSTHFQSDCIRSFENVPRDILVNAAPYEVAPLTPGPGLKFVSFLSCLARAVASEALLSASSTILFAARWAACKRSLSALTAAAFCLLLFFLFGHCHV